MSAPAPRLLTPEDIADWLQVTPQWVYEMARTRQIPAIKLGRYWRFDRDSIQAWLIDRQAAVYKRRTG